MWQCNLSVILSVWHQFYVTGTIPVYCCTGFSFDQNASSQLTIFCTIFSFMSHLADSLKLRVALAKKESIFLLFQDHDDLLTINDTRIWPCKAHSSAASTGVPQDACGYDLAKVLQHVLQFLFIHRQRQVGDVQVCRVLFLLLYGEKKRKKKIVIALYEMLKLHLENKNITFQACKVGGGREVRRDGDVSLQFHTIYPWNLNI